MDEFGYERLPKGTLTAPLEATQVQPKSRLPLAEVTLEPGTRVRNLARAVVNGEVPTDPVTGLPEHEWTFEASGDGDRWYPHRSLATPQVEPRH